jgi:hypothetical protein
LDDGLSPRLRVPGIYLGGYEAMCAAANLDCFWPDSRLNSGMNSFVARHIKLFELIGVCMRIFSFSLVSWLGPKSPFMFVWIFNTTDAVMLTWCSTIKRDNAYMLLNGFWILVGIVGILRAGNILH